MLLKTGTDRFFAVDVIKPIGVHKNRNNVQRQEIDVFFPPDRLHVDALSCERLFLVPP